MSRITHHICATSVGFILAGAIFSSWGQAINPTLPTIPTNVFNVTNYGALGNGSKDNTTNIQNAINAASTAGGGIVEIPAGTFLCGAITLQSSIGLQVDSNALLQMLPYGTFPGASNQFIYCKNVHDITISGGGTIDGQGLAWWSAYSNNTSLPRPLLLQLYSCDRLFMHDVTFQNAPYHHCGIRDNGGNITISNLVESAPAASPNTDGLDFVGTNCIIENCRINVGDDNIALGSTGPVVNLLITNCAFGSGHGVSIGSTVTDGITNLTVVNCTFNGTVNGIRMKAAQDASAIVTNLNYLNLSMTNVGLPIVIWTYYNITETPTGITPAEVLSTTPSNVNSTTPMWSGITISNLNITSGSSSDIGGIIWGPTEWPISNITLVCITNNAPNTFDLYNVYGVQIINSRFNFSSGNTFTLCNAGVTVSNTVPGANVATIGGAISTNSLALYNASVSLSSTDVFAANPIILGGSTLSDSGGLTLPISTTQNFLLGAGNSTIAVTGNLNLNSTLNIASVNGFTATNYTLFTYTGSLSGQPMLGSEPEGFEGYTYTLNTNTPGQIILQVSPPPPPLFANVTFISSNNSIVLSGTGGVTNGAYNVLASTNLALPLNLWTVSATGFFDGSGNFVFSNTIPVNAPQWFFRLQIP